MNRRRFLHGAGAVGAALIGGCIGGSQDGGNVPTETYEQCNRIKIRYDWFPQAIQQEVDTALADGQYEANRILLAEAIDADRAHILVNGTVYRPDITSQGETEILRLNEVDAVRRPEPVALRLANEASQEHAGSVTLSDDEELRSEQFVLESGEETEIPLTDRFGSYQLQVQVEGEPELAHTWEVTFDETHRDPNALIEDDGIRSGQLVAEVPACSWQN